MAIYVNTSALVKVSTLVVSAYVKTATLNTGSEAQDMTGMGVASRINASGLKTWGLELEMFQDAALNMIDTVLGGLVITPAAVTVKICPGVGGTPATASATNPVYWGSAVMESYTPIQGPVGGPAMCKVVFRAAGDLTRTTSGAWDA